LLEERKKYYDLVDDWNTLPSFLDYFEGEALVAKKELLMHGKIESLARDIPFIMDRRFTQLQILNAAIEYFDKQLDIARAKHYRKYLENYQKVLSSRDVEKYVNGEKELVDIALIMNEISLMRNIFISITKGIDAKSFQVHNITKLRTSGLEDATID
jgi:hypothetical protein